ANAISADYNTFAISPDGRRIVFTVSAPGGGTQLATRQLEDANEIRLSGSESATNPFFAPDGLQLGFFANGKLKTISVRGGAATAIAEAPDNVGGYWSADGNIYYASTATGTISRIPAGGGARVNLTGLAGSVLTHRWPVYLDHGG